MPPSPPLKTLGAWLATLSASLCLKLPCGSSASTVGSAENPLRAICSIDSAVRACEKRHPCRMRVTAPARSNKPRMRTSITPPSSDLEFHDPLDDQRTGDNHQSADDEDDLSGRVGEKWLHVRGID